MRILGVDPGSRRTGWGVLDGTLHRPELVDCGVIRVPATAPFAERLHRLGREFEGLLHRLRPEVAAVEAPFHGVNARSALQLAHARGVLLAALAGAGVAVVEYPPATVKAAVTGNGRAPKAQVQAMVLRLLGTEEIGAGSDLSDALAVALCHLATGGRARAMARAKRKT